MIIPWYLPFLRVSEKATLRRLVAAGTFALRWLSGWWCLRGGLLLDRQGGGRFGKVMKSEHSTQKKTSFDEFC